MEMHTATVPTILLLRHAGAPSFCDATVSPATHHTQVPFDCAITICPRCALQPAAIKPLPCPCMQSVTVGDIDGNDGLYRFEDLFTQSSPHARNFIHHLGPARARSR